LFGQPFGVCENNTLAIAEPVRDQSAAVIAAPLNGNSATF
jgi:hypothetical protein